MTDLDRRTLLGTLAGAALAPAVAGCSGGGGEATTTETGPFGVSNLVFVAGQPTGYEEYEQQPDATYEPDDVVWLYMNLENVATEDAGDGERRMHVSQEATVTGPTGEVVLEDDDEVEQTVAEGADRFYYSIHASLPSNAAGGEYELAFELTDEVAGETVSESATFSVDGPAARISTDGPFGVSNLAFAREEPTGYGDYVEQPDATYGPGATVWLYFEVDGVAARLTDDGNYETDLTQELSVTGPDGESVLDDSYEVGTTAEGASALERYFLTNYVRLPDGSSPGEYDVSFTLTDEIAGSTASESATFAVEGGVVETDAAFRIAEAVFTASEATDYGEYEQQPDGTYAPGDPVWVYLDVVGMGYERTAEGRVVRIEEVIRVTGPDDGVVYENTKQYENTVPESADLGRYYITDGVTTQSNTPTGRYTLEIGLRDLNTGDETSVSGQFRLAN